MHVPSEVGGENLGAATSGLLRLLGEYGDALDRAVRDAMTRDGRIASIDGRIGAFAEIFEEGARREAEAPRSRGAKPRGWL